ncbi:MAG: MFS transporter [Pseudomonadota bacterium]
MKSASAVSNPVPSAPPTPATKKGVWGWMFFDWAAQPFFTVVTTFIFGPYVVSRMVDDPVQGQASWALAVAIAGLFMAFLSPILGAIADKTGPRKPWIGFFAVIKIACLCALWFAAPGSSLAWVLALFILATIAAEFSTVFNDSMMPSIVSSNEVGKVSNIAWGLGYLGGMIVLIIVLLLLAADAKTGVTLIGLDPLFGLDPQQAEGDRATPPLAALWYLVFILPMFMFTPDRGDRTNTLKEAVRLGVGELVETIKAARERAGIFRFLVARMIYQDGVNALIALGGTFAATMFAWSITELGIFGIILNVVAVPACLIAAKLDPKLGSKKLIITAIIMLMIATVGVVSTTPTSTLFGLFTFGEATGEGLFASGAEKAYIFFGLLIGAAFGPVQASSRSYLARSVHPSEAGQFFGLYAFAGRATSFLAPATVSFVTFYTGSATMGMATLLAFFAVGLIVLIGTPYPAAQVNAEQV